MLISTDIRAFLTALDAYIPRLAAPPRLLGLDLGSKTLGLAICDEGWQLASPLHTIADQKFTTTATALAAIISQHSIAGLVLGLPLHMDGTESPRAQASRQFAANLHEYGGAFVDLPILLADERLTTAAVTRTMISADLSRKRRSELVDKLAASYLLQGVLDQIANTTEPLDHNQEQP